MTTLAYHHETKTIACDSRNTAGSMIVTDKAVKKYKRKGQLHIMAGEVGHYEAFIDEFEKDKEPKHSYDVGCFTMRDGKVYARYISDDRFIEEECTCNDALGSGKAWALAAMDFGKNAKQAVDYAKTRDIYTGGRTHVYRL